MFQKLSIKDLDIKGKKVLVRVDFNVPTENGQITDASRILAALPTIQYVIDQGGIPIIMSHMGRPKGVFDKKLSLAPCAAYLEKLLNRPVLMAKDCRGQEVEKLVGALKPGQVVLLENLRFHSGEEEPKKEPAFVSALAKLGDLYVDDAFGCAHRPHASIVPITKFFPGKSAAGFLMQKEIQYLGSILVNPKRPFYAILGGAKISSKFRVIESLMKKADVLLIGGAMANTFLKSEERQVGDSLYEKDFLTVAREFLDISLQPHCRIVLPIDFVVAKKIEPQAPTRVVSSDQGIPDGYMALDIGPKTIALYINELNHAETVLWNGPLGVFECPPFDNGTTQIATALTKLSATTIIGGGDSIAAIERTGLASKISHLSTGGGATLELIEFGTLPGLEALSSKNPA